uniref:Uncharacterized protein n=1 Tax=Rhizophora mucronata TaxID=61149 RepID=A0A2P2QQR0_RHIMU
MLLSMNRQKTHSTFADWGKGWADPEIRRQRLERKQSRRKPRKLRQTRMRNHSRVKPDMRTVRGRIESRLSKQKR